MKNHVVKMYQLLLHHKIKQHKQNATMLFVYYVFHIHVLIDFPFLVLQEQDKQSNSCVEEHQG